MKRKRSKDNEPTDRSADCSSYFNMHVNHKSRFGFFFLFFFLYFISSLFLSQVFQANSHLLSFSPEDKDQKIIDEEDFRCLTTSPVFEDSR